MLRIKKYLQSLVVEGGIVRDVGDRRYLRI